MASPIPVIDLRMFLASNTAERAQSVLAVQKGLEEVGFLTVIGHDISDTLMERVCDAARAFFDQSDEQKDRVLRPSKDVNRGFGPMQSRTIGLVRDNTLLPSLQEGYGIGPLDVSDPYYHTRDAGKQYPANIWPDDPEGFAPAMQDYYDGMERLFRTIMKLFAIALGVPEDHFAKDLTHDNSTLRLIHYPALARSPLPGEERSAAHTDSGTMTILYIDDTPDSLQVQLRSGEWINVNRVPGAFIINIGDMMARWTNDKWVSTLHRVVNPPLIDGRSARRLSIAHFCQTNYDTVVAALPNCTGPDNPARYPPITSGEYSRMRSALRYGYDLPAAS